MSRMSEERISFIAHTIVDDLVGKHRIDPTRRGEVLAVLKGGFFDFEAYNDRIDEEVRLKIASLSKKVPEGSDEWRLLYKKYRAEAVGKHRPPTIK